MDSNRYLTDQIIPYLGNKRNLLDLIRQAVQSTGVTSGTFFDAFAGSTVVSRLAKTLGFRVIANDWEPYSRVLNLAAVKCNRAPEFGEFGGIDNAIDILNDLEPVRGYIATHYCPGDDEHYDPENERMFYTQANGRRIDAIREQISAWQSQGMLTEMEEAVLLALLIYQGSYCSNTSGVFKGFHRGWGGATKTAWYRIRSTLTLAPPVFWDNGRDNLVFCEDANSVIDSVESELAYFDPPYNQHQYSANYHLLNSIALWDKPKLEPRFEVRVRENGKAAIRNDWTERRSRYGHATSAAAAFEELVNRTRARHILVSYSTDGIIPLDDLLAVLASKGKLSVVTRRYKRYRVSSQRPSPHSHNVEFVAVVDVGGKSSGSDVGKARAHIRAGDLDAVNTTFAFG